MLNYNVGKIISELNEYIQPLGRLVRGVFLPISLAVRQFYPLANTN